jgi:hypothetical protein
LTATASVLARMSSRNGDFPPLDATFPATAAERASMQNQLNEIFLRLGTIGEKVDRLALDVEELKRNRSTDAPALAWAKWQRGAVFWTAITAVGGVVVWAVNSGMGRVRSLWPGH